MPGSNFTYVNTIPASGDNPSVDQPNMLGNTTATNGWVSQDHYGFNTSGPTNNFGGLHQQVTFPANNVPTPPTSPPVLFTNIVGSLPQLFFYSGTAAQSANQYLAAANGSTMLLGGIVLKWGNDAFVVGATRTVTFTNAFPNNIFYASYIFNTASPTDVVSVSNLTTIDFLARRESTSGTPSFYWIAIGN